MSIVKRLFEISLGVLCYAFDCVLKSVLSVIRKTAARKLSILYYHGISDCEKESFINQMKLLKKISIPVPIDASCDKLLWKRNYSAVSFDDGFESSFKNGCAPALKMDIPVAIFIVAGKLGQEADWFSGKAYKERREWIISAADLEKWKNISGLTVGSHGMTHRKCSLLNGDELFEEVKKSKELLSDILNVPIIHFSYPHGDYNDKTVDALDSEGYKFGYTIDPECVYEDTKKYYIGRFAASPNDWSIEFYLKVKGAYRWLPALRQLKKKILNRK